MGTLQFQRTDSWMWKIGIKSTNAIVVFGLIYELSKDEDSFCTTSLSNIAESFNLSRKTVTRCVQHLEEEGLIYKDSVPMSIHGGKVNRYRINIETIDKRRTTQIIGTRRPLDVTVSSLTTTHDDPEPWVTESRSLESRCPRTGHDDPEPWVTESHITEYIKENRTEDKQNIEQKSAREEEPLDDLPDFGDEPSFDYLFDEPVDETPKPVDEAKKPIDEVLTKIMKEKGNYFDDYRLNDMYNEFLRYRKKVIKKPIKDPMAYRKNLYRLAGDPIDVDKAVRIIEQTIDNEWRGFFALKEDKKTYETSRFERERAMDMAWLAKMKKQEQEAYAI